MKYLTALALALTVLTVEAQIPTSPYGPSVVPSTGAPASTAPQGSSSTLGTGISPTAAGAGSVTSPATTINFQSTAPTTTTTVPGGGQNPAFNPSSVFPGTAPVSDTTTLSNQPATTTVIPPTTTTTPTNNPIQAQEFQPSNLNTLPDTSGTLPSGTASPTDVSGTPIPTFP